jgi:hypothetical protein
VTKAGEKAFCSIQVLELDFLTPSDNDASEEKYKPSGMVQREQGISYICRPEEWLKIIEDGMRVVLSMYREAAPFGPFLYERVGEIRVEGWRGGERNGFGAEVGEYEISPEL